MPLPLLLDPNRLFARKLSGCLLQKLHSKDFGEIARLQHLPNLSDSADISSHMSRPADLANTWRQAVAEELLLRYQTGHATPQDWLCFFGNIPPFKPHQEDSLQELMAKPAACAVFPLASTQASNTPAAGRVWQLLNNKHTVFIVPTKNWGGQSGMLAAEMAQRAAAASPEIRYQLAHYWIISGKISPHAPRIEKVKIGNKLQLCHQSANLRQRSWLLPAENEQEIPDPFPGKAKRFAFDCTSAWNHICRDGTIQKPPAQNWPLCHAYHTFTSQAREPALAAALLSAGKNTGMPIHLWSSEAEVSRHGADDIACILQKLGGYTTARHSISSRNMQQAEKDLTAVLSPVLETGENIIFNVTQGNRLMSFAVHSLARRHRNLMMIYRDYDAVAFEFTLIYYHAGQPVTRTVTGKPDRANNRINWDVFFKKNNGQIPTEAFLTELCNFDSEKEHDNHLTIRNTETTS